MTVESATYISDLAPANPPIGDPLTQGADHLRLIKTTIKTSFPAVTGPVTASHTDLNQTTGLRALVAASAAQSLGNAGNQSINEGNLTLSPDKAVIAGSFILPTGSFVVPSGIITMWAGLSTNIPAGWNLCDGTAGTPDLRDKFILGASAANPQYATGGAASNTFVSSTAGGHSHNGATGSDGAHNHTATADSQGYHNHTGSTTFHTLTTAEIPSHTHTFTLNINPGPNGPFTTPGSNYAGGGGTGTTDSTGGNGSHAHNIYGDGAHAHNIAVAVVGTHTHVIYGDGTHNHTGVIPTIPPFFALCLIMKL